jgi:hypothetical protein
MNRLGRALGGLAVALLFTLPTAAQEAATAESPSSAELRRQANLHAATDSAADALGWLLDNQHPSGRWGGPETPMIYDGFWSNPETHKSWTVATTGLAVIALLDAQDQSAFLTEAGREDVHRAVDAGIDYLVANARVKRPNVWDTDNTWAYVYGLAAFTRAARDPRLAEDNRAASIAAGGRIMLDQLMAYQTPAGGWAYYDMEAKAVVPAWATSFQTAVAILGLLEAEALGWVVDREKVQVAVDTLVRCRLPDGSYTYSVEAIPALDAGTGIDRIRGGLSRIQVGNLALMRAGAGGYRAPDLGDEPARGLGLFFREHHYLDIARGRPHPHEAYHYNSGYFYFFGHYYAGELLPELPPAVARRWAPALVQEVAKTQAEDGSMIDYFMNDYGRPYGVAYGLSALLRARTVLQGANPSTSPADAAASPGPTR